MVGKKNKRQPKGSSDLFTGLLRGHGGTPVGSFRNFPTADQIAQDRRLIFEPASPSGKVFLGMVNAERREKRAEDGSAVRSLSGGTLIGFGDDRHLCSVAGSRAGKGRSLLINNLLTWGGSAMVLDPKGDLAMETAHVRARSQKVYLLDPFNAAGGEVDAFRSSFNPLTSIDRSDTDAMISGASLIADALVPTAGERDAHWAEAFKQFLEALILHVCTSPDYEGRRTLGMVHELLSTKVEDEEFGDQIGTNTAASGAIIAGAISLYEKSDKERSGVISTGRRFMHFLGYESMRRVLEDGPFKLSSMQDEQVTLYLSLPAMKMGSCSGWLRLMVNLALNAFEANSKRREFQRQRGGERLLVVLDEAAVLGRMERLEAAIGQVAGLGVKLWTIWQDLNQPAAIYGKRWQSFVGNSSVLTFFGINDQFTLDYIEKRLGTTLVYSPAHRTPTLDTAINQGELGQSYSLQSHPLMTASEIAETFDRDDPLQRQLVFLPRIGPVILQRAYYDQHEAFRKLHARTR
ncbi:type IV secretory system conjugative DNA transfer family protein [Phycisphaerales bacterium ac7]